MGRCAGGMGYLIWCCKAPYQWAFAAPRYHHYPGKWADLELLPHLKLGETESHRNWGLTGGLEET